MNTKKKKEKHWTILPLEHRNFPIPEARIISVMTGPPTTQLRKQCCSHHAPSPPLLRCWTRNPKDFHNILLLSCYFQTQTQTQTRGDRERERRGGSIAAHAEKVTERKGRTVAVGWTSVNKPLYKIVSLFKIF